MLKNYFLTAFRNCWRNKTFSLINVLGLAIGISAALVIFLIVSYEFSFDRFEKDGDRIYRVVLDAKFNGSEGHSAGVQAPLSNAIAHEMTGIEASVPVMSFQGDGNAKVTIERENANAVIYKKQPAIIFTNPAYFQLLPYQWIAGNQETTLKAPFSVVLTEKRAAAYFPGMAMASIPGHKILYNEDLSVTVSGIVKNLDKNTLFTAEEFISFATIDKTNLKNNFMMDVWNDWMVYSQVYVKLAKDASAATATAQMNALLKKYNSDAYKDANNMMRFHLQPLNDIHFNMLYQSTNQRTASKTTLYGLLAIAAFLLLLGCINFINLTTAQASQRAKEIGVRKTMGSSKWQLTAQFLSETFFITAIATLVSVLLTPLLLRMFADFIPPGLHFDLLQQPWLLVFLLLLTIAVSFLSGLYPALILSGFNPVMVLKNQAGVNKGQTRNAGIRKTLTVAQFVIAQFFVIATVIVSKQISYSIHSDLGFNKEAIINIESPRDRNAAHTTQLLNEIKVVPGVAMVSSGFFAPADKGVAFTNIGYNNGKEIVTPNTQIRWGDPNYIKVYQMKLLAGRNVEASDSILEFLVNESFAHAIGFLRAEEAVGKFLEWNKKAMPIVGVMKDFHDQSTHAGISPVVLGGNKGSIYHIKLAANSPDGATWKNAIAGIQKAFKELYPEEEFNYKFVDEMIAGFYEKEQHTASLLQWATGLSVLISCLGLLGLVIYTTNTRSKEIGIRKILGASVANIVSILSKDFLMLVLISFVIAVPLAWWAMYSWLQDFAFKTNMSWWIFAASGLAMLAAALITLSIQTIKTATANPAQRLRTE